MDNWQTRYSGDPVSQFGRSYERLGHPGYEDSHYENYGEYDGYPYAQNETYDQGRRFERNRNYKPTGREGFYKSRGDPYQQHDSLFGNSMYLPAENPVFNDPFGTPQPGAYVNDGFVFQDENDRYEQEMEPDYAEPDYDDDMPLPPMDPPHSDGKGSVPKTDKQPQKSTKDTPVPSRQTRPAPWDVFGERDSDETSFSDKHTWKTINAVMRLVVAVVFFVIIAVTAIVSRLTLLLMTYNVRPGAENFTVARLQGRQHVLKEVTGHIDLKWVWALMIVMTAPYIFTAITCLWKIIFKKTEPLRCGPLFAAMTVETLHSLGLCTIVLYVLPSFDPVIGCLMLLNVAFFPGLIQVFQGEQKPQVQIISPQTKDTNTEDGERAEQAKPTNDQSNGQSWRVVRKILDVVMVVLHLGSMFVWSYRAHVIMGDVTLAVLTPVAMLLTSLSFWDNYVSGKKQRGNSGKKRTQSTDESVPEDAPKLNGDLNAHTPKDSTNQNNTNTPKKSNFLTVLKRSIKKRRTKITLMTSLWKIILTIVYPALAFGYGSENCLRSFFFFHDIPGPRFIAGQIVKPPLAEKCSLFTSLDFVDEMTCHDYYPLFVAALNVFCSILCYKLAKSACKVLLQIPCFVMPLALTPPITLVLLVASYVDPDDFMTVLGCNVPWVNLGKGIHIGEFLEDFTIVYWVPAGFAAYISLLYICGHVWNPRAERMSRTDKLFSKPLYCGVLLDGSLMLNRRRDEDDPAERTLAGQWIDQVHDVGGLELDEARSALRRDTTPLIYICATMWHESETEMIMMLKSVFRLDADQSARKNAQLFFNITDPDYYEFEAHVFFDDAFQAHTDDQFDYAANDFVKQLVRVIDTSASAVHNTDLHIAKPRKIPTPYGGRLVWSLPGGNTLTAHLKDKAKIRHRKRWSQVMYMYYFLGYKLISPERMSLARKKLKADNTYLLALDGDVDFQPEAVQILVDRMKQTPELGAACGRIHPIGSGPMVWYQKFEYAVSHWLQKATEHILGCVLCSPGCFSLFRGSALMDDNVMKRYTTPPTEARHYVQYDQGEDRWLCTLLLQQGYRVEYCAASDSYTFAPEGFYEFYNQRRRWTPSTMANIIDLLGDWKNTTKNNQHISVLYIIYQLLLLGSGIITPGTIFLLIVGAVANATQDSIPLYAGLILNAIPIFIFVVLCFKADSATQLAYAGVLSIFYTILMMLALVGIIRGAAENGFCSVSTSFLVGVVGVFLVTALLHPMECTAVLHGFLYFVSIPSMSMLLLVYSLANLHVVSWGTREVKSAAPPPPQQGQQGGPAGKKPQGSNFITDALSRLADTQNADSDYSFSFGNLFRCLCCPREGAGPNDVKFQTIMQSIEILDSKVTEMTVATSMAGDSLGGISELPEDSPPASPPLDSLKKFSAVPELFEGAKEKVNPVFEKETRDELKDPMWAEDANLGAGAKEFIDDDEKKFWVRFIGKYLFPLDKDDKHEKAVREELLELRNKVSLAFLLTNTLFVVLISSLQIISENTTNLSVEIPCGRNTTFTGEKIEPISVTFTLVFGVMLTLQFLAMLFHRYSTMLHIISITEIKFRKLTRQVLGMQTDSEEEQPTVEETIDLVRVMQAIRPGTPPAEPEADYGEEIDTPVGTAARKRSGGELWGKLNARAKRVTREQTLSRAFMRNFEKLAHQLRAESTSENSPVELKAGVNEKFGNLPTRQRHTLLKMAKDDQYKDHILKRSKEAKRRWNRAFAKLRGGKHQFLNLVREAKEVKEEEEEEAKERMAETAFTSSGGLLSLKSPSPRTSFRRSRGRQQAAAEGGGQFLDPTSPHADYPGYAGGGSPRGSPRHHNRGGSRRSSGAYSGQYDESGPSEVFNF